MVWIASRILASETGLKETTHGTSVEIIKLCSEVTGEALGVKRLVVGSSFADANRTPVALHGFLPGTQRP